MSEVMLPEVTLPVQEIQARDTRAQVVRAQDTRAKDIRAQDLRTLDTYVTALSSRGFVRPGLVSLAFAVLLGLLFGLGAFTFGYGKGHSYLVNDPAACANCHVMDDHFDAWRKSSHGAVATCNDCHLPHHPIGKWVVKADNGFFHSLAFTLENFPEPIRIKPRNRRVTQGACLHCHQDFVHAMLPAEPGGDMLLCIHCHGEVGHARR